MCRWLVIVLGCVWVLWHAAWMVGRESEVTWALVQAYPRQEECEEAGQTSLRNVRARHPLVNQQATRKTEAFSQLTVKGPLFKHTYQCLPDTIDPRRPKSQ